MQRIKMLEYARLVVDTLPTVKAYLSPRSRYTLEALKGGEGSGNFGHSGRPGEIGGSAPVGTVRIAEIGDKNIENKINSICKEMGFPENKIFMATSFTSVLGSYNTVTDQITLSPFAMGENLKSVLSHEITHAIFQKIDDTVWEDELKKWTYDFLDVAREDMDYDEVARYEDNFKILVKEFGGVSEYSNKFWNDPDVTKSKILFKIAVNETFAEIARLDVLDRGEDVPPNWREVYKRTFKK